MDIKELERLHSEGKTNRTIATLMGVNHKTVAKYLGLSGLKANGRARATREVDGDKSKCSVCGAWDLTTNFPKNHQSSGNEYYLTYCKQCRKQQMYQILSSNYISYLKDKYRRTRVRANKSGITFEISIEAWISQYEKQNGKCFYSDEQMEHVIGQGHSFSVNTVSVDKIYPEKGYVDGNIVFCINRINTIKNNMSLDEMRKWTPDWYERVQNKLRSDSEN